MKIIVLQGMGRGKTFIGNILQKHYQENNIPSKRIIVGRTRELKIIENMKDFDGYLIIETNMPELPVEPWQTITFQGGD